MPHGFAQPKCVCRQVKFPKYACLVTGLGKQNFEICSRYSLIKWYQYITAWVILLNNTINRPKGCNLLKKRLCHRISCEFCKISRNNFLYKIFHLGHCFWIKFCKSYKDVYEGNSLVKFLQSCHFNIKWRKDLYT